MAKKPRATDLTYMDTTLLNTVKPTLAFAHRAAGLGAETKTRWMNDVSSKPAGAAAYSVARQYAEQANARHCKSLVLSQDDREPITDFSMATIVPHDGFLMASLFDDLDSPEVQVVVLDGVLDRISDPRMTLRYVRKLLKLHADNRAIVTVSSDTKEDSDGLPKDSSHIRHWSMTSFVAFMVSSGFKVELAAESADQLLVSISADEAHHAALLLEMGLPAPHNALIITTEHADTKSTGGIGSYVQEVEQVLGQSKPLVLFSGLHPFSEVKNVVDRPDNLIDIHDLMNPSFSNMHTIDWLSASMTILTAVDTLLFLYDQIDLVEYQDYQGVGARIAEAKKSAMLPGEVWLRARCHGAQIYTERASQHWRGLIGIEPHILEKVALEYADEVSSPTQYLLDLYTQSGIDVSKTMSVDRLPYRYADALPAAQYQPIERIVFLGKRNTMKGYHHFVDFVGELLDEKSPTYNPNITSVVVFGNVGDDHAQYDDRLKWWQREKGIELEIGPVPREEVLRRQHEYAPNSLFILPYGADNHPVAVIEMIANYCQFIAYKTGGIPEIVPEDFHAQTVCSPDFKSLAALAHSRMQMSPQKNRELVVATRKKALSDQHVINEAVIKSYAPRKSQYAPSKRKSAGDSLSTVMVPTYNTGLGYISELVAALNQQTLHPKEVIFVDDGSATGYDKTLIKLLKDELELPFRVIRHAENQGLAAARNTALEATTTKYLINVDSDDIPLNAFIYDYVSFLENNPDHSVAICGLKGFKVDIDAWNVRQTESDARIRYCGIGGSTILGTLKNSYGHAASIVRTADAQSIGGWDASDRSKWEDWAFYTTLYGSGKKIFNIPKINYLYRVHSQSMIRTASYGDYQARLRIIRALTGSNLQTWDAYQLFAMMQSYQEVHEHRHDQYHSLSKRASVRAALKATHLLDKTPRLKSAGGKFARLGLKGYKQYKKSRRS